MHTKTVSIFPGRSRSTYFRSGWDPWLCIRYLKNHVELPADCTKLRLVSTPHEPTEHCNYWDIKQDGKLVGVRAELTNNFRRWNMLNFEAGDRYVYIDYEE